MALVNIQEKWSAVNGSTEQADGFNNYAWVASRAYTVLYDASPADGAFEAQTAVGLPSIGSAFSGAYAPLKLVRRRAVPIGPFLFEVICEYQGKTTVLNMPYEKSWQEVTASEPADKDADGNMLVNVIGDPITGQTREVSDPVYVVTRSEAAEPATANRSYWNAINSDVFKGWPIGTAKMLPIVSTQMIDGVIYYWRTTYRIQFRADGWNFRFANEGIRYRPTVGATPIPVRDLIASGKALLRANGTLLNGTGLEDPAGESIVWLTPTKFQNVPFAPLGLT